MEINGYPEKQLIEVILCRKEQKLIYFVDRI